MHEKRPAGFSSSEEASYEDSKESTRPDYLWPEIWLGMSKAAKRQEKREWVIEKPQLDNARKLRGVYFIDREDEEYKETIFKKTQEKKLETPLKCFKVLRKIVGIGDTHARKKKRRVCFVLWKFTNLQRSVGSLLFLETKSHRGERIEFTDLFEFGVQFSNAPSDENSGSESRSG